jgi:hypothetical protein
MAGRITFHVGFSFDDFTTAKPIRSFANEEVAEEFGSDDFGAGFVK